MLKVNTLLVSVLLTCALLLVTSQHRARKAFIDLERAESVARKHEVEWSRLQLEQSRLAKHSLIDAAARVDLKMQPVTPDRTLYLEAPASLVSRGAARPDARSPAPAGVPGPVARLPEVR